MSALDELFDGHYFTDDPHVYVPIDEAIKELEDLRNRIAELEVKNERLSNQNFDLRTENERLKELLTKSYNQFAEQYAENERLQKAVELGTNLANYIADDSDVVMKDGKNVCENCQFNARAYLSKYGGKE